MTDKKTIVVIGNGMVGHRFIERAVSMGLLEEYRIVTFCEEPRAAYDRVGLTAFFAHRDAEQLMLARIDWYQEHEIELHIGDRASRIDRDAKRVYSDNGLEVAYDKIVLTTGSYPFVPPIPGVEKQGVFVYRTIEDLERIIDYGKKSSRCAVIGGGLLGLEAAKAAFDLGLKTDVIEFAPRLMPRQIDDAGSQVLVRQIEDLGVAVHLNMATAAVHGDGKVEQMEFQDGTVMDTDMLIVSAGIRPRDELARECGLEIGERGGVSVNDQLQTNDPDIYAAGEVALHQGMVYGLVAPGYEMAEIVAKQLAGESDVFHGANMSTKLKLMGVDVASFGDYESEGDGVVPLIYNDPVGGIYKKLLFDNAGKKLLGGVLVGDAGDYGMLASLASGGEDIPCTPSELAGLGGGVELGADSLSAESQVCSCNNVTKGDICEAIRDQQLTTVGAVKQCTAAGTGCGGCLPLVTSILNQELEAAGIAVNTDLCEHFAYTRTDLFEICKIKEIRSFDELLSQYGKGGAGCEVCKPTVASILASLWNGHVLSDSRQTLQDTNDRFLANMQRGGLYSVIPRVPGGEITPAKLIVLGEVAQKYGLYTKITGGQRIDLFGAQLHQLPDIWEELIEAGFESGHAYGKAVRTVKSCVGSTWCRYGVQDSVGFAIEVEKRYRGIRAPHKVKFAVSGCIRECAEAQSKDFGLVATENGYNLYVCGNGGAKPRHGDLLAADIDEETAIRYIDRVFMYYIFTADKLTRTSVWMENLEGGLEHLKEVVLEDKLGICGQLEERMQYLVDTYECEWKKVVDDPIQRQRFRQFVNSDATEPGIEFIDERGQKRPADWPKDGAPLYQIKGTAPINVPNGSGAKSAESNGSGAGLTWVDVGAADDFAVGAGAAVKYGDVQLAVFHTTDGEWYATQNMCPHKNAFVLSRGIVGTAGDEPKVACPLHKKPFSLKTGACLSNDPFTLKVFPVRIVSGRVELELPPMQQLNAILATDLHVIGESDACRACEHAEEASV